MSISNPPASGRRAATGESADELRLEIDGVDLVCEPACEFAWVGTTWDVGAVLAARPPGEAGGIRVRLLGEDEGVDEGAITIERLLSSESASTDGRRCESRPTRIVISPGDAKDVTVFVPPGTPAGDRAQLSVAGLAAALALEGRGLLHAAGFRFAGKDVLALADEGGGKSTLAACVVAAGGAVCDDDTVVIRDEGPGLVAKGLRGAISLRFHPKVWRSLDSLSAMVEARGERSAVPLACVRGSWVDGVTPEEIWFLAGDREADSAIVRKLAPAEALARLIPATNGFLLACRGMPRRSDMSALFRRLVEDCRCLQVNLGRDLLDGPGAVLQRLLG